MAYNRANDFCRNVHNYYERGEYGISSGRMVLAAIGAVAGSVVPPMAKGSAKEAWAGLSGSTSALQGSMDQAFSAGLLIKRRGMVAKAGSDGSTRYASATSDDDRVVAAIDMARECATASATAEQQALQQMMSVQ